MFHLIAHRHGNRRLPQKIGLKEVLNGYMLVFTKGQIDTRNILPRFKQYPP